MSRSILQPTPGKYDDGYGHRQWYGCCYICERQGYYKPQILEEHHVFEGANRKKSEHYGLKVYLCRRHHTGDITGDSCAVHSPSKNDYGVRLKQIAQRKFEETYDHEVFMREFGRNWL